VFINRPATRILTLAHQGHGCFSGKYLSVPTRDIRTASSDQLGWAGNPEKTLDKSDGNLHLQPRGSFSRFLEDSQGRCVVWSEQHQHLSRQLWPLLSAAERQAFMADLSRQQNLMINELNHRVRNTRVGEIGVAAGPQGRGLTRELQQGT
jgi:hypothetical protein